MTEVLPGAVPLPRRVRAGRATATALYATPALAWLALAPGSVRPAAASLLLAAALVTPAWAGRPGPGRLGVVAAGWLVVGALLLPLVVAGVLVGPAALLAGLVLLATTWRPGRR